MISTFAALKYRNYSLVWLSSWLEHGGQFMETAALLWLVNEMTGSPFLLTLVGFCRLIPMVFISFIGGIVADRVDRRNLLTLSLLGVILLSLSLAILVHTGLVTMTHIIILALLSGVVTSFNHPARQSIMPNLVPKESLMNAITLDSGSVTISRLIGMPIAGYIILMAGVTPVFGLRAAGALLAIVCLLLARIPPTPPHARKESPWRNLAEGLSYLRGSTIILPLASLFLLPIFSMQSYTNLLPIFAVDVLKIDASGYGLLQGAPGLGALIAIIVIASLRGFRHKGLLLLSVGMVLGLALIAFSGSEWLALSLALLVIVGCMNGAFMALNTTLIQSAISDEVRGRVMSLREVARGLGPVGALLIGAIAEHSGAPFAVAIVGGICLAVCLVLIILMPRVRKLE
ncbi:MFS transporter [Chloroflexota bacterium]